MTSRFFIPKRISRVLTGPYRFQWDSLKGFHIRLRRQGRKKAAEIASASTTQVRRFTGLCEAFCRLSEYSYFELLSCFLPFFFSTYAYSLRFLAMKALNYNCRGFLNIIWIWRWGELVPWDTCKLSLKLTPGSIKGKEGIIRKSFMKSWRDYFNFVLSDEWSTFALFTKLKVLRSVPITKLNMYFFLWLLF